MNQAIKTNNTTRHSYILLDGLRGIAAISIAVLHMPRVFDDITVPNAHLAVDFFLQLSGFVIAYAYADRISINMKFSEFIWLRINRLYPTFILGILLGLIVAFAALFHPSSGLSVNWTLNSILCAGLQNFFMLPAVGCQNSDLTFSLNPPMWSVFHEIIINIIFYYSIRLLTGWKTSAIIVLVSLIFASSAVITKETLDFGFGWSDFFPGLMRLNSSFFIGVLIFKIRPTKQIKSNILGGFLLFLIIIITTYQFKNLFIEILSVLIIFPIIITFSSMAVLEGSKFNSICTNLGKLSYVLYVIHKPLYQIIYGIILQINPKIINNYGAYVGVIMLASFSALSLFIANTYEPIARNKLNKIRAYMLS